MTNTPGDNGLRELVRGPTRVIVEADLAEAADALGLLEPGGAESLLARGRPLQGRGRTARVPVPGRAEHLVLRPVLHGGLLGNLRGGRLLGLGRPLSELRATRRLRAAGAPVPRAVLVAGWRAGGPFWRAALGTLFVQDAVDGIRFLQSGPAPERIRRAAAAAGAAVRRFHDAGGRHADLHVKNLLLREQGDATDALVIDLDRARAGAAPKPARRMAELMRLYRSLDKFGLLDRVGARGCAVFFAAYVARERALRRDLRAALPRERMRLRLHQLHYRRP